MFFQFALFSDKPEVFLPKYSQTAILHAAHFRRVVKLDSVPRGFSRADSDSVVKTLVS